jgi:hypothetical protein
MTSQLVIGGIMDQKIRERKVMAYMYRPAMTCLNLTTVTVTRDKSLDSPEMVANGLIVATSRAGSCQLVIALSD